MLILLGLVLAVASTTLTLARANVFAAWRDWVEDRSAFFGDLVNCTYCTSHWVSFIYAAIGVRPIMTWLHLSHILPSWFILSMALVTLSSPVQCVVFHSHKMMKRGDE